MIPSHFRIPCSQTQRDHLWPTVPPAPGAAAIHLSLLSSASGLPQGAAVAATEGQNVSLPCNLSSCKEVTWFTVRNHTVLLLLTARVSSFAAVNTVERYSLGADRGLLVGVLELHQPPPPLLLLQVDEADSGLYFCSGVCGGTHHVGPGVSLQVGGKRSATTSLHSPGRTWYLGFLWYIVILLLTKVLIIYDLSFNNNDPQLLLRYFLILLILRHLDFVISVYAIAITRNTNRMKSDFRCAL